MEAKPYAESPVALRAERAPEGAGAWLPAAAWWLLGYTVLVIVWGAFVRATGAGAGCGSHWPLCNGEVLPPSPSVETLIELSHRLSSGLLGLFVAAFVVGAFVLHPRGHAVRWGASVSLFFVVTEALLGAGLVRFEWVVADDSIERVYVMAFHLVNTFLLLAAMTVTAWLTTNAERGVEFRGRTEARALRLVLGLAAVLVVGASGAVTALGDTLILRAGIRPEDSPVVASLFRSRFYHPTLAIAAFAFVAFVVLSLLPRVAAPGRSCGRAVLAVFAVQLAVGALNVQLMAPVWMQLVHLAASDVLWILLVLFSVETLAGKKKALPPEGKGSSELTLEKATRPAG